VTQSQAESQGAGPCNIRGIFIRRPAEPRSWTSPGRRQKLDHSFPWNSRGVRAQGHPITYAWGRRGLRPQLGINMIFWGWQPRSIWGVIKLPGRAEQRESQKIRR